MPSLVAGVGRKPSDFLVIPLCPDLHTGDRGIHIIGVKTWEDRFRPQILLLDWVNDLLPYDLWELAGIERSKLDL